ncbi:hypothetical protein [Clostridium merdae]|uniref:hypothetical protein n=1 Tax=Clostridium merdae TaxID=1958780 RepID=UPI000A2714EB|nr:hypothetical protein [Clostridium merdae]
MTTICHTLKECIQEKSLVELYTNGDDEFSVGLPLYMDDKGVVVFNIDPQGRMDGYSYYDLSSIHILNTDTSYLQKLNHYRKFWEENQGGVCANTLLPRFTYDSSEPLLLEVLRKQQNENRIVSIETCCADNLYTGFLIQLTEKTIVLNTINIENAKATEKIIIHLKDIVFAEFNSIDNLLLESAFRTL